MDATDKEEKDDAKDEKDVANVATGGGDVSAGKPVLPVKDASSTNSVPVATEPEAPAAAEGSKLQKLNWRQLCNWLTDGFLINLLLIDSFLFLFFRPALLE